MTSSPFIPAVLIFIGCLLRIFVSATVGLNPEDSLWLTMAKSISFNPLHPHLIYAGGGLDLVGLYLLKLSHILFGDQILLLRLPWILAGTMTLGVLYHLVKQALGRPQALLAAFLLTFDQFHVTWTRSSYGDVLVMAAEILLFWSLWKGLVTEKSQVGWFLLVGFLGGVGYQTKKTFPLVLLGTVIYLLTGAKPGSGSRRISKGALPALIMGFAFLILPVVLWEIRHPMESHYLLAWIVDHEPGIPIDLNPLSLYLGEIFSYLWPGMLEDYWNWHMYPVHWVAGIAYLLGAAWTFRRRRQDPFVSLMLSIFLTVSIFFLFFKTSQPGNHFWWASLGLIPAIVLAADWLAALRRESRWGRVIVSCLCAYLALHLVLSDYRGGFWEPVRSGEEWTRLLVKRGEEAMAQRQYAAALQEFLWASKLDPGNATLKERITEAYTSALHQKIKR